MAQRAPPTAAAIVDSQARPSKLQYEIINKHRNSDTSSALKFQNKMLIEKKQEPKSTKIINELIEEESYANFSDRFDSNKGLVQPFSN